MKQKSRKKIGLTAALVVFIIGIFIILGSSCPGNSEAGSKHEFCYKTVKLPDTLDFAGEPVPLNRFYVREALDREMLSNAYFHSQTIRFIKLAPRYFHIIEPVLKAKGIPDDFKYLAVAESCFDPRSVSPAGAKGFWQFMKGTAIDYGLEVNREIDERYNVEKATYAACNFLNTAYEKFGTWTMVAAAYNRGMSGVQKQMSRQKENNYYELLLNAETARYVYRILALKLVMENPEKYNFYIPDDEKYPIIPTRDVKINGPVKNFADFAHNHGISYKVLKDFNPWLRDNSLTNSKNKTYIVKIPDM